MGTKWLSLPKDFLRNVSSNFKEYISNLGLVAFVSHMDCNEKPQVGQNDKNSISRKVSRKGICSQKCNHNNKIYCILWRIWELLYCFFCGLHQCAPSWPKCPFFQEFRYQHKFWPIWLPPEVYYNVFGSCYQSWDVSLHLFVC